MVELTIPFILRSQRCILLFAGSSTVYSNCSNGQIRLMNGVTENEANVYGNDQHKDADVEGKKVLFTITVSLCLVDFWSPHDVFQ